MFLVRTEGINAYFIINYKQPHRPLLGPSLRVFSIFIAGSVGSIVGPGTLFTVVIGEKLNSLPTSLRGIVLPNNSYLSCWKPTRIMMHDKL